MWLVVLFDLPVGTKKERKAASGFRLKLLDLGFEMTQFSVYLRFCAGKEQAESYERKIERFMPVSGKESTSWLSRTSSTKTFGPIGDENANRALRTRISSHFFDHPRSLTPTLQARKRPCFQGLNPTWTLADW